MALRDGARGRGTEAIIMARREGIEAHVDRQGETEADLMSADVGGIDIFTVHVLRDGNPSHRHTRNDAKLKAPKGSGYLMPSNAEKLRFLYFFLTRTSSVCSALLSIIRIHIHSLPHSNHLLPTHQLKPTLACQTANPIATSSPCTSTILPA